MDDKRRGHNIFQLYGSTAGQGARAQTDEPPEEHDEAYAAVVLDPERQSALLFYDAAGLLRLLPYRELIQVLAVPPGWLVLIYNNLIVNIEGYNLSPLVKYLQSEQLTELYCFSGDTPEPPDDGETPVITHMIFQTYAEAEAMDETTSVVPESTG